MTNELKTQNEENKENEVVEVGVVKEDDRFVTYKDTDGKYRRKAKFKDYSSFQPQNKKEKIWLMNVIENADEEAGKGLSDNVGAEIEVADVITRRYDKVNEDTGEIEYGVLTYLITPDKEAFVTSSKAVYFTVNNAMDMFGYPDDEDYENIIFQVKDKPAPNGQGKQIFVKVIG